MTHRRSRQRQLLARVCAGAAVVCLALAGLGYGAAAAQDEQPVVRPDVFRASAASEAVSAFLDRDAFLPVNDAFRFIALDGTGTYESSNQTARASVLYPGNGIVSGPGLACSTFGGQFPEQFSPILDACLQYRWPLSVFADSLNPDGSSTGATQLGEPSDPLSAEAVRAVAHAAIDSASTDAALSELRVLGLPAVGSADTPLPVPGAPELDATVVTVEGATSTTDQRIDATGTLVARSTAVLEGVRLVGGLIEIDSIRSLSTISDDGRGSTTRETDLAVSGVTVGGIPAQITDEGLVVGEPTGADGPLAQQLTGLVNDLVRGLGVEITTLPVEEGEDESGVAYARTGGLLVEFDVDVAGLPTLPGPQGDIDPNGIYHGVIQLGRTGATGIAAHIEDVPFSPADPSLPDLGETPVAVPADVDPPAAPDTGTDEDTTPDTAPEELATAQQVVSVSEILSSGRVRLAYLAFTLIALAACISPKFVLPARFPGRIP